MQNLQQAIRERVETEKERKERLGGLRDITTQLITEAVDMLNARSALLPILKKK